MSPLSIVGTRFTWELTPMYLEHGTINVYMQSGFAVNGTIITQTPRAEILQVMLRRPLMPLHRLCTHSEHLGALHGIVSHSALTHGTAELPGVLQNNARAE